MDKAIIMGSDICTFCYRPCFQSVQDDCDGKKEELNAILKLFGKLVERYLGSGFQFFENVEQEFLNVKTCEDCVCLIKGFCDLYHEWKCLEMRLEWKLRKLMDVMNAADKVRSRKLAFQASFNAENVDTDEENGLFKLTSRFRRNFERKCKIHDANSFPKVLLHRRRLHEAAATYDACGKLSDTPKVGVDDVSNEKSLHLQLGWISTFAALLFLSHGFEKPRELNINEDMDEFLNNFEEIDSHQYEFSQPASPQPNFERSEVEVQCLIAEESPEAPVSEIGELEEQEITGINAKLQQQDTNRKCLINHRRFVQWKQILKPFACHCCNFRKFTSYQRLLQHRRAFTHFLMRKKFLTKSTKTKKKVQKPARKRVDNSPISLNQKESNSSVEIKSNLENIGELRPLRSRRKRILSEVKSECESDDNVPATSSDDDDDQEWNTSSSDEASSSSNSSNCEYTLEDDISCSFCSKVCRASTLVFHQKKCLSNPANVQLMTKRKKRRVSLQKHTCDIDSCIESFNFKEELDNHKKLHGSFPCAFCEEKLSYAPDLALHEREHAKNIKAEEQTMKKRGKLLHSCARCKFSTFKKANYITHFLNIHMNLPQRVMCPICKLWTSRGWALKSHITRCHGDENDLESVYTCNQCPAYFLKKSQLNLHQKSHPSVKQERTCVCDVISCKKAFVTEKELEAHKRLHGNFPCKFCSTVESYAPNLAVHELIHRPPGSDKNSASGQYGCARCSFYSDSKRKYTRHHAIRHLQLRLATELCSICQVPLSHEQSKKQHFLGHHNTKTVDPKSVKKCKECPAYFLKMKQLYLHKKRIHNRRSSDESSGSESEPVKTNTESEKPFVCKENHCRQRFECQELLDLHMKMHGNLQCQFCSVVKHYAPKLAIHELAHSNKKDGTNKNKVYNCARCKYSVKIKQCYVDHFLKSHLHFPVQRVICPQCKILLTKASFKAHYKAFHDINNVDPSSIQKCDKCSAHFLKRSQLEKHVKKFHFSTDTHRPVKFARSSLKYCEEEGCKKRFELTEDLENHQKLHGKFTCSFCPTVESYAPNLALHEITHLPSSSIKRKGSAEFFNCSRCTSTLYGKFQLVTHFLEVHLKLPLEGVTCQICREKLWNQNRLWEHVEMLHNTEGMREEDIARCEQCPAYFQKAISLVNHKKKMHGEDPLKCVDCGKRYKNPYVLRRHRRNKHKKKESEFTFVCDLSNCDKRFETIAAMESHKHRFHNPNGSFNPMVCHVCGKKCLGITALKQHMKLHSARTPSKTTESKRYVCEECGKFFKAPAFLEIHKLFHSGPASWRFSCLFCEKKCYSEESLFGHLRTHTNEKVFICEYCGQEYAHAHNLRNHKNKQHDANDLPKVYKPVNSLVSRKGQKLPPRLWK